MCAMGRNGGSEMFVYNGKAGVAMWFADDGSLRSCGDPVGRLGSSLAVRGLCQPCTRGDFSVSSLCPVRPQHLYVSAPLPPGALGVPGCFRPPFSRLL